MAMIKTTVVTLRRNGITVPYTDILIAACALTCGATVLHADVHFELMKPPHTGLKTESHLEEIRSISGV